MPNAEKAAQTEAETQLAPLVERVKTRLGEAFVDGGFELRVGEDVGPVAFDALAHQFADIERIDAGGDA